MADKDRVEVTDQWGWRRHVIDEVIDHWFGLSDSTAEQKAREMARRWPESNVTSPQDDWYEAIRRTRTLKITYSEPEVMP